MLRMHQVARFTLLLPLLLGVAPLQADTLYQSTPQGKLVVIQRDAIVVKEDSSSLFYKHFDLKERRVVKVRLNKGSLPYAVDKSSLTRRQQIVGIWKRFGYKAAVTDQEGTTTRVFDVYLDFYPPGGRGSLLEVLPPRTAFAILLDGGGADEIEFSKIDQIRFQGDRLKVALRNGQVEEGQFLKPTEAPAEARLLGITDHYHPASEEVFDFSLPLARLKEIRFEP